MNKLVFFLAILFIGDFASAQQTFTITTSGYTYVPAIVNASVGDKITFNAGSMHPVLQVSEATYAINGSTALPGGFSYPSGNGDYITTEPGTLYYICTNHISLGMKGQIIVTAPTGIANKVVDESFDVFPNPVSDYLFIKNPGSDSPKSISLFDMAGKMIYNTVSQEVDINKTSVSVSDLKKGMYFITVVYPNKTYTRKFIKL